MADDRPSVKGPVHCDVIDNAGAADFRPLADFCCGHCSKLPSANEVNATAARLFHGGTQEEGGALPQQVILLRDRHDSLLGVSYVIPEGDGRLDPVPYLNGYGRDKRFARFTLADGKTTLGEALIRSAVELVTPEGGEPPGGKRSSVRTTHRATYRCRTWGSSADRTSARRCTSRCQKASTRPMSRFQCSFRSLCPPVGRSSPRRNYGADLQDGSRRSAPRSTWVPVRPSSHRPTIAASRHARPVTNGTDTRGGTRQPARAGKGLPGRCAPKGGGACRIRLGRDRPERWRAPGDRAGRRRGAVPTDQGRQGGRREPNPSLSRVLSNANPSNRGKTSPTRLSAPHGRSPAIR